MPIRIPPCLIFLINMFLFVSNLKDGGKSIKKLQIFFIFPSSKIQMFNSGGEVGRVVELSVVRILDGVV